MQFISLMIPCWQWQVARGLNLGAKLHHFLHREIAESSSVTSNTVYLTEVSKLNPNPSIGPRVLPIKPVSSSSFFIPIYVYLPFLPTFAPTWNASKTLTTNFLVFSLKFWFGKEVRDQLDWVQPNGHESLPSTQTLNTNPMQMNNPTIRFSTHGEKL